MFGQPVQVASWVPTVHHETTPGHLSLLASLMDVEPPPLGAGTHVLDLGCGRGFSALVLAAANPDAQIHGIDIDPVSIASARRLARLAGLNNVVFTERSFAEVDLGSLPSFDFISCNLVYSYVTEAARTAVQRIVREKLVSGGIFALDFVPLPGAGLMHAAAALMREHAHHSDGSVEERAVKAMEFLRTLIDQKFGFFGQVTGIENMLAGDSAAFVHEFFNHDYRPFFEHELIRTFEGLGLACLGNAVLSLNDERLCLNPEYQTMGQSAGHPSMQRALKSYALNLTRSSCAFIRGLEKRGDTALNHRRFRITRPPSALPETATIGQVSANIGPAKQRLASLVGTAWTVTDFMVAFDVDLANARQWLAVLADVQTIQMLPPEPRAATPPKFNEVLLTENESPIGPLRLSSPVTGSGIAIAGELSLMARAYYRAPNDVVSAADDLVRQHKLVFRRDGQAVEEQVSVQTLEGWADSFERKWLPILKALGCL